MIGKYKENGKIFAVEVPKPPRDWENKLFNDKYFLDLTQTMQGPSSTFENYALTEWCRKQRHFYVQDRETKDVFCPIYAPLKSKLDYFESEYALGYQKVNAMYKGLKTTIRAFVPNEGLKEIWTITIENTTSVAKTLSLFSAYSFEDKSYMGSRCHYDEEGKYLYKYSFPTHAKYEDKYLHDNSLKYMYMYSDTIINSYDTNKYRFYGCEDSTELPFAVAKGECSNTCTQGMEDIIGVFEHRFILQPNEQKEINIIIGVTRHKNEIATQMETDVKTEFDKVQALWDKRCSRFIVDTPSKELNYLVNCWFKKQVTYLSRTNRRDVSSPVRNEMQDTMGYAFVEPYEAYEIVMKVLQRQYKSGYIKQWNIHDGSGDRGLSTLRHSDAPIWLIICFVEIISHIIKDDSLYNIMVGYKDTDDKETVLQHLERAAYYMTEDLGSHGLCLMRDGDWTDPMNGVGRGGKGESVWNTMALIYAIKELNKIRKDNELMKRARMLIDNIEKYCWDGKWYLAAFDDSGRKVGTNDDEEGKIFLNTQTWAIISGVATGERLKTVQESLKMLETDCGYILSLPAFTQWNEKWGKISVKQQGALENGAVYCHGTLFKALGDYVVGNYDGVVDAIIKTLPTNPKNPNEINMQLPLFIPNYYFGIKNENFGRSSCVYNTGTTSWIFVLLDRLIKDRKFGRELNGHGK